PAASRPARALSRRRDGGPGLSPADGGSLRGRALPAGSVGDDARAERHPALRRRRAFPRDRDGDRRATAASASSGGAFRAARAPGGLLVTAAATRTTAGAAGRDAAALVSAHLAMLAGSYLTEVISGPGRARYAFSAGIPDVTMNFAVGLGAGHVGWLEETARARGRVPAFLADGEAALGWLAGARAYPARWMVAEAAPAARDDLALAGLGLCLTDGPAPDASFLAVFGACHDGGPIDAHVARYYVPVLAAAQPVAGV